MNKGKLIVIESGTDASGKETQTRLLFDRLIKDGHKVKKITFPDYDSRSSELVKMYLEGMFGDKPKDVNPYVASTFYAVDRYASYKVDWKKDLEDGVIIIADRYTTSNMVHQAAKFDNEEDKEEFLDWLYELEFIKMELPEPDEVIFLNMDVKSSLKLMKNRSNKITGEAQKDIHEKDSKYMEESYNNALWVAKKYNWNFVECTENGEIKSIEDIHEDVYAKVKKVIFKDQI